MKEKPKENSHSLLLQLLALVARLLVLLPLPLHQAQIAVVEEVVAVEAAAAEAAEEAEAGREVAKTITAGRKSKVAMCIIVRIVLLRRKTEEWCLLRSSRTVILASF